MADDLKRVGLVFKEEGAVDFRKTLQEVNIELNKNANQFKVVQSQWDESTTKVQKLTAEQEYLTNAYEIQEDKVKTLSMQLTDLENAENKNTTAIKRKQNELTSAQLKLQNYKDRLDKTSTSLENAKNGIETTTEKLKRLNNEVKENENEFKLTQSQYTAMTSKTQKLKDEQGYLTNAYNLQEEKVHVLYEQLQELESVEDKNTTAISNKRNELLKARTELNNYNTRLQEVTNQLENNSAKAIKFGENIEKVGNKIEGAGKKLSAFSVAVGSALVACAKSAIDFEDAFVGVEKTVDGTDEQFEKIKQGILEMSTELPSTTTEIAEVAEAAGQLGIKTDDILDFTKVMIDLGNSTNLSADEAASALAKFANVTNMSADDYSKLGSTIVALGNNFATTEQDIVDMATRLASTGEITGLSQAQILALSTALSSAGIEAEAGGSAMAKLLKKMNLASETYENATKVIKSTGYSLRDLQLMASNNSKDFKALAQSIGYTADELKTYISNADSLRDFANVAGYTAEEFQKLYGEDSVKALSAFIGGLQDTERNGKGAVEILNDMGITEVRLSNAVLAMTTSTDLMNNAINLANESWEDNTALTNEASKRYGDLKSQITIAINKIKALATSFGNKLTPYVSIAIDKIDDLTSWVENLNDEDVELILNIAKTAVVIGPLITIIGKVTSKVGSAIKAIGTFTQAIGVVKGTVTTTSTAVNGLASVISAINPVTAIAVAGLTALAGATIYFYQKEKEATQEAKDFAQSMEDEKKSVEDRNKSIDEATQANIAQINNVSKLKDELKNLVDENGKVKEGYESRVDFILTQLNDALGTEYTRNGEIVDSYKDIQNEIDNLIAKKKAEIQLNAEEEKYKIAIEDEQNAIEDLKTAHDNLGMSYDEAKKKCQEYVNAWSDADFDKLDEIGLTKQDYENLSNYITAYENAESRIKSSLENQKQYEQDYAAFTEGKYEEIGNTVKNTTQNWSDTSSETLRASIEEQTNNLNAYKEIYERTGDEIALKNQQQAEENLNQLIGVLQQSTSTINENSPEIKDAWTNLATSCYSTYYDTVSKMPDDLSNKIQEMTGVTLEKTPELVNETSNMSQKVLNEIEKSSEFKQEAINNLKGMLNGLNDEELRNLLQEAGVQDVDKVM